MNKETKEIEEKTSPLNEIRIEGDRFQKTYKFHWAETFSFTLLDFVEGHFQIRGARKRVEAEKNAVKNLHKLGIKCPEIIEADDLTLTYDRIRGENLNDYLQKGAEPAHYGEKVAEIITKCHVEDFSFGDRRLGNFMVDQDGELYSIDHEWSMERAGRFSRGMDWITLLASLHSLPDETRERFVEGLETVRGRFGLRIRFLSELYYYVIYLFLRRVL